jgi:hypothetical protein
VSWELKKKKEKKKSKAKEGKDRMRRARTSAGKTHDDLILKEGHSNLIDFEDNFLELFFIFRSVSAQKRVSKGDLAVALSAKRMPIYVFTP